MAAQAPLGILVCADLDLVYEEYWPQECGAATQNLLLAAHARGLGAVWTGVYPVEKRIDVLREMFDLPNRIVPFAFVVIGHTAEEIPPTNRFRPDRVHHNGW
jgi:nitroreductase